MSLGMLFGNGEKREKFPRRKSFWRTRSARTSDRDVQLRREIQFLFKTIVWKGGVDKLMENSLVTRLERGLPVWQGYLIPPESSRIEMREICEEVRVRDSYDSGVKYTLRFRTLHQIAHLQPKSSLPLGSERIRRACALEMAGDLNLDRLSN